MAQNVVELGFDIPGFNAEKKTIADGLIEIYELGKKLGSNLIPVGSTGGWTELTAKVKAQEQAIKDLQDANTKFVQTQAQMNANNSAQATAMQNTTKATQQNATATQQTVAATQAQSKSLQQNVKDWNDYKNAISNNAEAQKQLKKDVEAGRISADGYRQSLTKLTVEQNKMKARSAEVAREIKIQSKEIVGVSGAYAKLNQEYLVAQKRAKDMAAMFGAQSDSAIKAAASAQVLDAKLKEIDKTVGQSQRNVGNYGSAFTSASAGAGKLFSVLRNIAYIVPGLGLAGVIGLIIDPIIAGIKYLTGFSEASEKVKAQQSDMASAFKTAADSVSEEMTKVTLLKAVLESENATRLQKVTALKQIKAINVDYFGQLDLENDKVEGLGQAYDLYVTKLIKSINAKANIEQLTQALKAQNEIVGDLNKNASYSEKYTANNLKQYDIYRAMNDFNLDFGNKNLGFDKVKKQMNAAYLGPKELQLIADLLNARDRVKLITDQIKGDVADAFTPEPEKTSTKKGRSEQRILQSIKEALDAEFELYKIAQARKIKLYQEDLTDVERTGEAKLIVARLLANAEIELIEKTNQKEIDLQTVKLGQLATNLISAKGTERNNLLIDIANTKATIVIAEARKNDALLNVEDTYQKNKTQIAKDEEAKRIKLIDEAEKAVKETRKKQQQAIDGAQATSIATLDKQLANSVISRKEYAKRKADIENEWLIVSLTVQKKEIEGLREVARLRMEDLTNYENQIIEINAKIESAKNKPKIEGKTGSELKDNIDDYAAIEKAAEQTVIALIDAKYQREIDGINKLIDANNQLKETEVANINNSTISAQEKAAQLIILENKVAANNAKLQREANELKRKQAIADRQAAVVGVLSNAAVAVFKLIAETGTVGILAGAVIAAQATAAIAGILAQPLPSYAEGTDNHPGGFARYGEAGAELIQEPGKKARIVDTETIGLLARGTRVTPLTGKMVIDYAGGTMIANQSERLAVVRQAEESRLLKDLISTVERTSRSTERTFRKQKAANVHVHISNGLQAHWDKSVRG